MQDRRQQYHLVQAIVALVGQYQYQQVIRVVSIGESAEDLSSEQDLANPVQAGSIYKLLIFKCHLRRGIELTCWPWKH